MDPRAFLDDWLTAGTLRPSTQHAYRQEVGSWLTWCESAGVDPWHARIEHVAKWSEDRYLTPYLDGRAFDGPHALAYIAQTSPEAARSHDRRITAITQFYVAAADRHLITGAPNLTDLRSGVDRVPDQPQRLTPMERAVFLTCVGMWGEHSAKQFRRDRLIAYLLLEGLRPGEVVRLDMRHLYELPDGTMEVRAPDDWENVGRKHVLEPLTVAALADYLPHRPTPKDGVHEVILGQAGRPVVSRYPNMLIRSIADQHPLLAQRVPPVTADVVAHTGFWDTPATPPAGA